MRKAHLIEFFRAYNDELGNIETRVRLIYLTYVGKSYLLDVEFFGMFWGITYALAHLVLLVLQVRQFIGLVNSLKYKL